MLRATLSRLTYSNVISTIALFLALSGGAYALTLPRNSVRAKQIARNAVGASEIKRSAVRSAEVKNFTLLGNDFKPGEIPAGPAGPAGKDGVNGAANVAYRSANTAPMAQGQYGKISVGCDSGERLIGGGAGFPFAGTGEPYYTEYTQLAASAPGILVNPNFHLVRALRAGERPDVWYAGGYQGEANTRTLTVYAICASP
jgi:hypothetical protein